MSSFEQISRLRVAKQMLRWDNWICLNWIFSQHQLKFGIMINTIIQSKYKNC